MGIAGSIALRGWIVAVDHLLTTSVRRIVKYSLRGGSRKNVCCRVDPAVLYIAVACVGNTSRCERTRNTEIIDIAAEMVEQRLVDAADGIAVAMQRTCEASIFRANRSPGVLSVVGVEIQVGAQDDVQVIAALHMSIEQRMAQQRVIRSGSLCCQRAQIVEVTELVETVVSIVDINLTVAHHVGMVHIQVVFLVGQHVTQVVIVCHTERHGVRIGLTQIGSGVECHPYVLVLIPEERSLLIGEGCTVTVVVRINLVGVYLPSVADRLVKSGVHRRRRQLHVVTRQYGSRCIQRSHLRHTTL